jgi:hypothetical protein
MEVIYEGQTYTFSGAQDAWLGPDGKLVESGLGHKLFEKIRDARRAASITRLDEVSELFEMMTCSEERAAAVRWLITTHNLGGLI